MFGYASIETDHLSGTGYPREMRDQRITMYENKRKILHT